MKNFYVPPQFEVVRDPQRCVNCKVCVEQCPNGVHRFDETHNRMLADESKCVDCQRCVAYCPTHALKIEKNRCTLRRERQLVLRCRGGDLEAGRHRRCAAVLHGQPQGAAGLLGPPAAQRLPGHEPAHRPAAGADGDPGVSGQEAGAHPARRPGAADHGADAAAGAVHAGAVLRHELRLHQLQRSRESGQSGGGAGDLL